MKYLIGIDAGTTNVKAVLFDEKGSEIGTASRENETIEDSTNCAEQDMEAVWNHAHSCLKEIASRYPEECSALLAIGVTGQGEGFWAVDSEGRPVQRAILWRDGRAVEEVRHITEDCPEIGKLYHKVTGTFPLTGNQMILTRWMKTHRPEVLARVRYVMFCKDWIRYRMTGKISADVTDSLTSLLDAQTYGLAEQVLEALELSELRDIFPSPLRSDEVAGILKDELADEMGYPRGIPVIAGALDTSATMVGLGAIHAQSAAVILGTTCACEVVFDKEECAFGEGMTRYEKHPVGDLFVNLQPTNNGTPNIDWMLDTISPTRNFNEIDRIVDSAPVGSSGVIYLPYIGVSGERAPFYHPYARAEFFGMSVVTTRADLIRAVYEGISLSIRDCLEEIGAKGDIFLAGGGSKSPVWSQMIADVCGCEVRIPSGNEQGAKGAALMAGVSQGLYRDYDEAVEKACSFRHVYYPDPVRAREYDLIYRLYRKLREHNAEVWNLRHQINKQLKADRSRQEGGLS